MLSLLLCYYKTIHDRDMINLRLQCTPEKSEISLADGHSPYHRQRKSFLACKQSQTIFSVYGTAHCLRTLYHKSFLCANRISCILAEHFLCNRNEFSQYIKKTFCISESLSVHYINFFIHGNQYAVRPAILLLSEHCRSSWKTYNH